MQNSAYAVVGKQRKNNSNKSKIRNKGWFNKECYEARKKFNVSRNIFTRNKNEINKQAYLSDKREYTKIKRNSKSAFKTIEGKRVANLAKTDPKGFWQNIKKQYKHTTNKTKNVSIEDMFQHFNTLYGSSPPENQDDLLSAGIKIDEEFDSEFDTKLKTPSFLKIILKVQIRTRLQRKYSKAHLISFQTFY